MLNVMTLAALTLLVAPISLSAQKPGDTVTVHVSASRWELGGIGSKSSSIMVEVLNTVINGKKLQLSGNLSGPDLLMPGDYHAALLSESHESDYEIRQNYRLLLPGNRSRTFYLTGIQE